MTPFARCRKWTLKLKHQRFNYVDIRAADGNFSISVNGREIVRISDDSSGGSLVIRDSNGRPIVQISGDSDGGSIKVTDANGKTRVNIHGSAPKRDTISSH